MGKTLAEGGAIYRDFYETKLPGVPLLMAGLWRMFGGWWPGYVGVQVVLGILGPVVLGRVVGRGMRMPVTLFGIVFFNFGPAVYGGFQLETVQGFLATLGACAAVWALRAGDSGDAKGVESGSLFWVGLPGDVRG